MSSQEIHEMMQLRHLVDEFRAALDTKSQTAEVIHNKIDIQVQAGMLPTSIRSNVSHWQFINNATTQSSTFEHNSQVALRYLTELEASPSVPTGAPPSSQDASRPLDPSPTPRDPSGASEEPTEA